MQEDQVDILQKTEELAASCLPDSDIITKFSEGNAEYEKYLYDGIERIRKAAEKIVGIELEGSSVHHKKLQYLHKNPAILNIWNRLSKVGIKNHLAQLMLSPSYRGEKEIYISIGKEFMDVADIKVPLEVAQEIQKWIKEKLPTINDNAIQQSLLVLGQREDLLTCLEEIGRQFALKTKEDFDSELLKTIKCLVLSLHLTFYELEDNKSYLCFYSKIADGKYILGSFAGRFEKDIKGNVQNIQKFSRGLLSYITYWEGIADYEKVKKYTSLVPIQDEEFKGQVKQFFGDFFNDLLFIDPNGTIKNNLYFEDIFYSKRISHKTGNDQNILVVRLRVQSEDAFNFLYCDSATNFMKIENYLETVIKQNHSNYNRVRLDVAIDNKIRKVKTLYTNTVRLISIDDAIKMGKIMDKGFILKFYKKHIKFV